MKVEDIEVGARYKNYGLEGIWLGCGKRVLFTGLCGSPIEFESKDLVLIESDKGFIGLKAQQGDDAWGDFWEDFYKI